MHRFGRVCRETKQQHTPLFLFLAGAQNRDAWCAEEARNYVKTTQLLLERKRIHFFFLLSALFTGDFKRRAGQVGSERLTRPTIFFTIVLTWSDPTRPMRA